MCDCPADNALCEELQLLADRFDELNTWLLDYLQDLDLLIEEHQLLTAGTDSQWRVWFAVDYCDIHGFLLPFSDLLGNYQQLKGDLSFRRQTTHAYLARMCVFVRLGQQERHPLLIAPYLGEFSHRFLTYTETELARADMDEYLAKLWNELDFAIDTLGIEPVDSGSRSLDKVSDNDLMAMLLEKYPNLVLIAQAEAFDTYERIELLFRNGIRAVPAGNKLGDRKYDVERLKFWNEQLHETNPRRGAGETERDSQALAIIEAANHASQERASNEAYFLISSSGDVVKTARRAQVEHGCEVVLPSGRTTTIVRPLSSFLSLLRHMHSPDHPDSAIDPRSILVSLRATRNDCAALERTFGDTKKLLERCPKRNRQPAEHGATTRCELAERRQEVEQSIERAACFRQELEDTQVILSDNPDFVAFSDKVVKAEDPSALERTLTGLVRRMLRDVSLRKTIENHVDGLRHRIVISVAGLNAQVDAYTRQLRRSTIAYLLEAPFHIRFQNATLRDKLSAFFREVETIAASNDIRSVERAFAQLVTYALSAELGPYEKELVELIVLLAFSRNSLAARLANACLTFDVGHLRPEFAYLGVRALLRYDWERARERCRSALEVYRDDPRFHFLLGYFAWREYEKTETHALLDEALAHTRKSIELTDPGDPLLLDETDNLAYFACEAGSLAEAHTAVLKLEDAGISPSRCNRLETIGKVYCALASSTQFDQAQRLDYVARGIEALEKCLKGFVTDRLKQRVARALEEARALQEEVAASTAGPS